MSEGPREIRLPASVRRAVLRHARLAHPDECCGFLVGRDGHIRRAVRMANVAKSPRTTYRVDDAAHIALRRDLRRQALGIIGVYHSHPAGPARPSPVDIRQAYYAEWIQLIVGFVPRPRVAAFRFANGAVTPLAIALAPPSVRRGRPSPKV